MRSYLDEHNDTDFDRLVDLGIGDRGQARALGEDVAKLQRLDVCHRFLSQLEGPYRFMWPHPSTDDGEDVLLEAFKAGLAA